MICACSLAGTRACETCPDGSRCREYQGPGYTWPDAELIRLRARIVELEAEVLRLRSDLERERGRVEGMLEGLRWQS